MGLMDTLRKAEKKGKELARRGVEAVRNGQQSSSQEEEAQRRRRQKMRVYPDPSAKPHPPKVAEPHGPQADPLAREMEDARRKAIVSVHGEDVDEKELGKRRKIA